jgi:hypothetical protein
MSGMILKESSGIQEDSNLYNRWRMEFITKHSSRTVLRYIEINDDEKKN